ncbi:hypothetical protein GE09DRAFT_1250497 [Coniochaeta sp. 2T2.1]|nr:hypothetical protein GE09DRAFT_1250497 [Coniochaeta sp. 2T2.1]
MVHDDKVDQLLTVLDDLGLKAWLQHTTLEQVRDSYMGMFRALAYMNWIGDWSDEEKSRAYGQFMAYMRQPMIKERITSVASWDMEVLEDIIGKIFATVNPDWNFSGWEPLTQPPVLPKDLFEGGAEVQNLDLDGLLELFSIDSHSETVSSTEAASGSAAGHEPAEPQATSSPNSEVLQGSSNSTSNGQGSHGPDPAGPKPEADLDPEAASNPEAELMPEVEPAAEADHKSETEPATEADPKLEVELDPQEDAKSEAEPKPEAELKPEAGFEVKAELGTKMELNSDAEPDHPADTDLDAGHRSESSNSHAAENDLTGALHSPTAVPLSKPPVGPLELLALPNSLADITDDHAE